MWLISDWCRMMQKFAFLGLQIRDGLCCASICHSEYFSIADVELVCATTSSH